MFDIVTAQIFFLSSIAILFYIQYTNARVSAYFKKVPQSLSHLASRKKGLSGSVNEIPKFAILRIIFGLVLLCRALFVLDHAFPSDLENILFLFSVSSSIFLSILLILGISVQFTLLILCIFQWRIGEILTHTVTLGNDVAAMFSLLLFLTNAGSRFSVDYFLIQRFPKIRKALLYFTIDNQDVLTAKILSLISYWLLCMYSLSMHLNEPAWMQGFAAPQLLTNNFMSRYWADFETLFITIPESIYFAILGMWIMLPWYLFIVPFIFLGGWFKKFIVYWGVLFFVLSTFVLQLGWLGEIELLFWAGLFLYKAETLEVFYDDRCNLCDKTVTFLKFVDLNHNLNLRPISTSLKQAKELGLSHDQVLKDLQGFDARSGRIFSGYELYLQLCKTVPLLLPLWPFLWIGKVVGVGPLVYRYIADRRLQLFGVCQISSFTTHDAAPLPEVVRMPSIVSTVSVHFLITAIFFLVSIPVPFVGWQGVQTPVVRLAHVYGMTDINVFNEADLKMAEKWFTLEQTDGARVPIFFSDGSRDFYHQSDRIYFGATLKIRRWAIDQPSGACLYRSLLPMLVDFISLHHKDTDYRGDIIYHQYFQKIADPNFLLDMRYEKMQPEMVCSVEIFMNYDD